MANIFRIQPNGQLKTWQFIKPFTGSVLPSVPTDFFRPVVYTLTASAGTVTITGQNATLKTTRLLTASAGTVTITGQNATLKTTRLLTASAGTFALAGYAGLLYKGYLITLNAGNYNLSGEVNIKAGRKLAGTGAYQLTGIDTDLVVTLLKRLNADPGTFTLQGSVNIVYRQNIQLHAGFTVDISATARVAPSPELTATFKTEYDLSAIFV